MSSSNARALLKAKRNDARVVHPFATYSAGGQLRCTACNNLVKHSSAWQGHLGSKSHRNNVIRFKERQAKEAEEDQGRPDEEEDKPMDDDADVATGHQVHATTIPTDRPPSTIEVEWEMFQRDVLHAPDRLEVYERATLIAEPEFASSIPDGFPSQNESQPETGQEMEENLRRKELRVSVMKQRRMALKRKRDAARAQTKSRRTT